MVRLAIVEDNRLLRKNLKQRLSGYSALNLVLVSNNGKQFLEALAGISKDNFPEVVLMDIEMEIMDGIEATTQAKALYPDLNIIILTVFDDEDRVFKAIKAGASGYLLKEEPASVLLDAIEGTLMGKAYMSPAIARKTMDFIKFSSSENTKHLPAKPLPVEESWLSKRELGILKLLSEGNSYQIIAQNLFLSEFTIQTHIKNIYSKLHVNNKISAIQIARDKKWFK